VLLWPDDGSLLSGDHHPTVGDHAVILDIETGGELARVETGSPIQTALFPAPGPDGSIFVCSHSTLTRLSFSRVRRWARRRCRST